MYNRTCDKVVKAFQPRDMIMYSEKNILDIHILKLNILLHGIEIKHFVSDEWIVGTNKFDLDKL